MLIYFKPLSVATNVVGLQTDDVGHVGQNSSGHVACVVGLQTDAVVVTETRFKCGWTLALFYTLYCILVIKANYHHRAFMKIDHEFYHVLHVLGT